MLVAAWLIDQTTRSRSNMVRLVVAASLVAAVVSTVAVPKDDWRGLVAYVNAEVPSDEPVVLDPPWDSLPYNHYGPNSPAVSGSSATLSELLSSRRAMWLVVQRRLGGGIPGSESEAWLDRNATLTQHASFARLQLRRYERKRGIGEQRDGDPSAR